MTATNSRESPPTPLARWMRGLLPSANGGPPPALGAARAQLSGWVIAAIALVGGAVAGFALVLAAMALPNAPASVVGLAVGVLLGSGVALTLASRYPIVRRVGGIAILLSPLLVLAAPFLLIAGAIALLRGTSSRPAGEPGVAIEAVAEAEAEVVVVLPRRARRKRA